MKALRVSVSLLALLTLSLSVYGFGIKNIFNAYKNRNVKLCFLQISINSATGQRIVRRGVMIIKAKRFMIFNYTGENEKIVIDDFRAIDYRDNKTYIYKLRGFNKILFLVFLGKKDLSDLFKVVKINSFSYVLKPKYQSNISSVSVIFGKRVVKELKVTDIYANKIIYKFHDFPCKRTQKGS